MAAKSTLNKPIVKNVPRSEFLDARQRAWLQSRDGDYKTENPSVYREVQDEQKGQVSMATRMREEISEIQSLIDSSGSHCELSSDITLKLTASRRERHDVAWAGMKVEMADLSEELEQEVVGVAHQLQDRLTQIDNEIEDFLNEFTVKLPLARLILSDLWEAWESRVLPRLAEGGGAIKMADQRLSLIEETRVTKIGKILKRWSEVLHNIGYLLHHDICKMIDQEAQSVNMTVVSNKLRICEVLLIFTTRNIEKEKQVHRKWTQLINEWRLSVKEHAGTSFRSYMESDAVGSSDPVKTLMDQWNSKMESLRSDFVKHINLLKSLVPPTATKTQCYDWETHFTSLISDLHSAFAEHLSSLQLANQNVAQQCISKMEETKDHLVIIGACDEEEAYQFCVEHLLPLIEAFQTKGSQSLLKIEEKWSYNAEALGTKIRSLFKSCHGAVHLWESHLQGLHQLHRDYNEHLQKCRQSHDSENQKLESDQDVLLDRLRQGSTEEVLEELLQESLTKLDHIHGSYFAFHKSMFQEVSELPKLVSGSVTKYDSSLCSYFAVDRTPIKSKAKKGQRLRRQSRATKTMSETANDAVVNAVEDVISTASGTTFYLLSSVTDAPSSTFLTQNEDPTSTESNLLQLPTNLTQEVYQNVRMQFLEHLEKWKLEQEELAQQIVARKHEELDTELDLRQHLHEARPDRIERDIHHLRAAELVAHKDRVRRHIQQVREELNEMKKIPQNLSENMKIAYENFVSKLNSLQKLSETKKRASELDDIASQSVQCFEKCKTTIHEMVQEAVTSIEGISLSLSESTSQYRQSLLTFIDGGNYSHEEVDQYKQKMDRLTSRIASAQGQVLKEFEGKEEYQVEMIVKGLNQFDQKMGQCKTDVVFAEKMGQLLLNTQIKIKTEVVASNSQAKAITAALKELSEQEDPGKMIAVAANLFDLLKLRVNYLYCLASQPGARVGEVEEENPVINLSAISATRNILDHTKTQSQVKTTRVPQNRQESRVTKSRQSDRANVMFGIGGGKDGSNCFLPIIRKILKEVHIELLTLADCYYRQKRSRSPINPELVEPTYEKCMEKTVSHLQSYRKQAEHYRNNCIDELHEQLAAILIQISKLPKEYFEHSKTIVLKQKELSTEQDIKTHSAKVEELMVYHSQLMSRLQPSHGHPSRQTDLRQMAEEEQERHTQANSAIALHWDEQEKCIKTICKQFVKSILDGTEKLLSLLDQITAPDDIISPCGDSSRKKNSLSTILYLQNSSSKQDCPVSSSKGKAKWPGLTVGKDLIADDKKLVQKMSAGITSNRTSKMHHLVVAQRDTTCTEFVGHVGEWCDQTARGREREMNLEVKRHQNWLTSVERITELYAST